MRLRAQPNEMNFISLGPLIHRETNIRNTYVKNCIKGCGSSAISDVVSIGIDLVDISDTSGMMSSGITPATTAEPSKINTKVEIIVFIIGLQSLGQVEKAPDCVRPKTTRQGEVMRPVGRAQLMADVF